MTRTRTAIRAFSRLAKYKLLSRPSPVAATFFITYRCNLDCPFCAIPSRRAEELSTPEILAMIDELHASGLARIGFSGGEALIRDDIGKVIDHTRRRGIHTSLFTNGHLVAERADQIQDVHTLLISLDGPEEIQNANRGEGSFDRVIEAIRIAKRMKKTVILCSVLTTGNFDHIEETLAVASTEAVPIMFHPIHAYFSDDAAYEAMALERGQVRKSFTRLLEMKKLGRPVFNSSTHLRYVIEHYPVHRRNCGAGGFYFAITPDGTLLPCTHSMDGIKPDRGRPGAYRDAFQCLPSFDCKGCFCYPLVLQDNLFRLKLEEYGNLFHHLLLSKTRKERHR